MVIFIALLPVRAWAGERRDTLLLTLAATAEESAKLEVVARERIEPLAVDLELRRVARIERNELRSRPSGAYFARAWIELTPSGAARLFLEHGASDRLLVRDVPAHEGNPELVREELGHILQVAVEGLKAGEEVGEPRREVLEQVAPQPRPEAPPRARERKPPAPQAQPWFRLGLRYEARWLGDGARFEDGPGVSASLASRLGAELGVSYRRPLRVEGPLVGARLESISLRALLTWSVGRRLGLAAGAGADFVHVSPRPSSGTRAALNPAGFRSLAVLRLQATYRHPLGNTLGLEASAGVDLDPAGSRYVFERAVGDVTILEPARVRPFMGLGVSLP